MTSRKMLPKLTQRLSAPPVERFCPGCERSFPPIYFRKWWGNRHILRSLCKECEPQKNLSEFSPAERLSLLYKGRRPMSPALVERLNAAHAEKVQAHRTKNIHSIRARESRQKWAAGIRNLLADEKLWVTRVERKAATPEWQEFFRAYAQVLRDALRRIDARTRQPGAHRPTVQECDPRRWIYAESFAALRNLYSACSPIPGRRRYRDPLFLEWETAPLAQKLKERSDEEE